MDFQLCTCFPRSLSSTLLRFYFRAPLLRPNSRKKGTLIIKRLLRNQVYIEIPENTGSLAWGPAKRDDVIYIGIPYSSETAIAQSRQ